ncbi:phosphate/phosphite/phosphonate ABC transporter substrate-binding protein [Sedimentibacter sp. MB31-C6]|uniref:phosphate/phosphite/phosphonate ABC transporter substrate-binding protein n=1 Tax=Sedimentibacter sp. MB31-C6 TaxID=3109366 RepID=UPI002DDC9CA0|nr:phosphate/phosphite/phosphonate ABC transporter substrate-binding protein [Sedimentibacter sp. MB36-C1]WSI03616.1 phosphate/phosphite/phosphonate ABC transporter substrate-binding protein [Sedimentibacter sp. MB36-C1]
MNFKKKLIVIAMLTLIMSAFLFGCNAVASGNGVKETNDWPEKLVFAYLPNEESADDNRKGARKMLMEDMTEYLGISVEVIICDDYNAVIETMRNGNAQIASFGPFSYIIANERSNAEAIVVTAKDETDAFYNSLLITHKDTGIKTMEDIRGKSMSFVDPASTSGNLVPRATIVRILGVSPEDIDTKVFSSVQYAGNHQNSFMAAANKSVEVAAVQISTYEKAIKEGLVKKEDIHVIFQSDPIPSSPIAIHGALPKDLKLKLTEFFTTYENAEYFTLSGSEGKKFIAIEDSKYDGIRDIAESMNLSPEELLK